jgi:hypothetical protein
MSSHSASLRSEGYALRVISSTAAVAWEALQSQWLSGAYSRAYWDLALPRELLGLPKLP